MVASIVRNMKYYPGKNLTDQLFSFCHFIVKEPDIQETHKARSKGQAF